MNDEPKLRSVADQFRQMADKIERNKDFTFGGACVIVPPEGAGGGIEVLIICDPPNVAQFWADVASHIHIILEQIKRNERPLANQQYR